MLESFVILDRRIYARKCPLLAKLVDLMISVRSWFHMSDERTTELKMICVSMKVPFRMIAEEFEERFMAYLHDAVYVFCNMCPAYYRYFAALHSKSSSSAKPPILKKMTESFELVSLAFAIKPTLE